MQLPTKGQMQTWRKLPTTISHLPSHHYTQRQQHHRTYIGLTENNFKTRYSDHIASFRHAKHRNSTKLSKHIWTLKDNTEHFISWSILSSHSLHNSSNKRCNLCLKEKFLIICRLELSTLNKCNELMSSSQKQSSLMQQLRKQSCQPSPSWLK